MEMNKKGDDAALTVFSSPENDSDLLESVFVRKREVAVSGTCFFHTGVNGRLSGLSPQRYPEF
jgi:hypothetical protein